MLQIKNVRPSVDRDGLPLNFAETSLTWWLRWPEWDFSGDGGSGTGRSWIG